MVDVEGSMELVCEDGEVGMEMSWGEGTLVGWLVVGWLSREGQKDECGG